MNRTLTINISGIIFHVEEDAYEKLNRYLSTIRSYFAASEGRDEIMADIEARIAELLKERVNNSKQVILMGDVDQVITIMGKPEDFAGEAAEQTIYEQPLQQPGSRRRRVFRDPDDKIAGGVCSGISAYFDTDPMWLRIIWALLAVFSFGTFFLIYILFWIILPEAKTTADKLEMRGEKVNINNIEKSIREEFDGIKKKVTDLKNDRRTGDNVRSFIHELGNFLTTIFKTLFRIISKLVYVLLIFISLAVLIAVLAAIFGSANAVHIRTDDLEASYGLQELLYSVFGNGLHVKLSLLALFLTVCIPFIMILYKAISRLAGVRKSIKALNITALSLWIGGVILSFYLISSAAVNFREKGISTETIPLKQPAGDILYLKTAGTEKWNFNRSHRENAWSFFRFKDGERELGFATLNIEPSPTDSFAIVVKKSARGETKKEAMVQATGLKYSFTQTDSVIDFQNYFDLKEGSKWRVQEVEVTVLVPVNKKVYLNKNMRHLIYDVQNVHNVYDGDMVGRVWIMTAEGLNCVDCTGLELNDHESIRKRHFNDSDHRHEVNIQIHENAPPVPTPPAEPSEEDKAAGRY